ncbi:SMEK domain-containing protein [Variovorax atrisoli]|uniref:SMEK domain-containing protein n=1 Tax=Variovorax atrisoli TaxID=3394203 RepID=UPI00036F72C9|nr:SMEK domain-containing protein [Variovorax paradoxus]
MPLEKARIYQNVVMKLSVLRFMVKSLSKRGKTDLNRDCESFFATVLNLVYGYALKNVNEESLNEAAIDLADEGRKLCVQVTATSDSGKIKKTIETFNKHKLYEKYQELRFLMLVDKKKYTTAFETNDHFTFDHKAHVHDIDDVLAKAESLDLEQMKALSDFIDKQLPSVSHALEPDSLLASAEQNDGKPPKTAARYLRETIGNEEEREWAEDFGSLLELHKQLMALSRNQREVISYMFEHGGGSQFGYRIAISIQTLQQRLKIDANEMHDYYRSLNNANLVDVDDEDRPQKFELTHRLRGSRNDAFWMLKDFLTADEAKRLIVDCDFSVLD